MEIRDGKPEMEIPRWKTRDGNPEMEIRDGNPSWKSEYIYIFFFDYDYIYFIYYDYI